MELITQSLKRRLITAHAAEAKAEETIGDDDAGTKPILKLFAPWAGATWLFSSMYEAVEGDHILFGFNDMGIGYCELGYASLAEIKQLTGPGGMKVERDLHFECDLTIKEMSGFGINLSMAELLEKAQARKADIAQAQAQAH